MGADGVIYVVRVFAMDKVSAKARSLIYGLSLYTYFITPFAGPALAQAYYRASTWRWAFGSLALIISGVSGLLVSLFLWSERRRGAASLRKDSLEEAKRHQSALQTVWAHARDLDGKSPHES